MFWICECGHRFESIDLHPVCPNCACANGAIVVRDDPMLDYIIDMEVEFKASKTPPPNTP